MGNFSVSQVLLPLLNLLTCSLLWVLDKIILSVTFLVYYAMKRMIYFMLKTKVHNVER